MSEEKQRYGEGSFDEELAGVFTVLRRPDRDWVLELMEQDVNYRQLTDRLGWTMSKVRTNLEDMGKRITSSSRQATKAARYPASEAEKPWNASPRKNLKKRYENLS